MKRYAAIPTKPTMALIPIVVHTYNWKPLKLILQICYDQKKWDCIYCSNFETGSEITYYFSPDAERLMSMKLHCATYFLTFIYLHHAPVKNILQRSKTTSLPFLQSVSLISVKKLTVFVVRKTWFERFCLFSLLFTLN